MAISIVEPTVLGILVGFFPRSYHSLFNYIIKPTIVLTIHHFSNFAKFRKISHKYQNSTEKKQILRLGSKFHSLQKTVGPTNLYKYAQL